MISGDEGLRLEDYLNNKAGASVSYPYTKTLAVYSLGDTVFAYLEIGKQLPRISLRADPQLAKVLRERYEEVSPGQKLDKRVWNTIIVSGQLSFEELTALIDHSYQLAEAINQPSNQAS